MLLLALCLPALAPLVRPGFIEGQDGLEHTFRVLALASAWQQDGLLNDPLPRWIPDLALGYGYPLFGVYSPLAYVLPAALTLLGVAPLLAVKVAIGAALLACAMGVYVGARQLVGPLGAAVAAVTYLYAPYTLANAYIRVDLAELTAGSLATLALAALLCLGQRHRSHRSIGRAPVLAALPLAALPLAHTLSAFTFFPTLAAVWLAQLLSRLRPSASDLENTASGARPAEQTFAAGPAAQLAIAAPRHLPTEPHGAPALALAGDGGPPAPPSLVTIRPRRGAPVAARRRTATDASAAFRPRLVALLGAPLLAAGLAAFFLLPALAWQRDTSLASIPEDPAFFTKLLDMAGLAGRHFALAGWGWFGPGSGWWNFSVAPGALGELGAGPSTLAWLSLPLSLGWLARRRERGAAVALALVAAAVIETFLMTTASAPIWQRAAHLTLLQFPWRFSGPLCLDTALLLALAISLLPPRPRWLLSSATVALALLPPLLFLHPQPLDLLPGSVSWPAQLRRELIGGYGTTGSGLFLPHWAAGQSPNTPALPPPAAADSGLHLDALQGREDQFSLHYDAPRPATLTLGTWYFPGWQAHVDGRQAALGPGAGGLLDVALPAGSHHLTIQRVSTGSETAGTLVSLLALAAALALFSGRRQRAASLAALLLLTALLGIRSTLSAPSESAAWSNFPADSNGAAIRPVAWRVEHAFTWGRQPSLDVVWLAAQAPAGDQEVTVQTVDPRGRVVAEITQRPRLGTANTTAWPAGMLVFDHVLLPLPPVGADGSCAGPFTIRVAPHQPGAPPAPVSTGQIQLPCRTSTAPSTVAVLGQKVGGLQSGRLPAIQPGEVLSADVTLRVPGPTAEDDVLALQLVSADGTPAAEAHSYGNVDLRFSTLWQPGDVVPFHLQLSVPTSLSPGVYQLTLQLLAPGSGQATPITNGDLPATTRPVLTRVKVAAPREPTLTAPIHFGQVIGLLLPDGSAPPPIPARPGQRLSLPLRWLALAPPPTDYTLFVHLVNASGTLVAQADAPPLDGRYPTSSWDTSEVVSDPRQLSLPPNLLPGHYTVLAGWYLPSSGERLTVTPPQSDDAVPVAEVDVGA